MRECESLSLILSCIFQVKEKKIVWVKILRRNKNKNSVGSRFRISTVQFDDWPIFCSICMYATLAEYFEFQTKTIIASTYNWTIASKSTNSIQSIYFKEF